MASWNYKPCRIIHENGEETWDIRSFYIQDDGSMRGWSSQPMYPFGETVEELKNDLTRMMNDVMSEEPLVLYAYTCTHCKQTDAQLDKGRLSCDQCLAKQAKS